MRSAVGSETDEGQGAPAVGERNLMVTITFSHYCERARWAFDRTGLEYEEHCPMPGTAAAIWKKLLPAHGTTVPVLMFVDESGRSQRAIGGSGQIMDWLAEQPGGQWLFPNDEARALSDWFDDELGWFSRAFLMNFFLTGPSAAEDFLGKCSAPNAVKWIGKFA